MYPQGFSYVSSLPDVVGNQDVLLLELLFRIKIILVLTP